MGNRHGDMMQVELTRDCAATAVPWGSPATLKAGRQAQVTQVPQGIALSMNGGTTRPLQWVEGMTFRLADNILTFRGGDLHLSGGSAYTVLKRQ